MLCSTRIRLISAFTLVAAPSLALAAGTSSHAMVVGGAARGTGGPFACATSGPQAREQAFFNTGVGLPLEGYAACSLSGGIDNQSSATGPVVSHQAISIGVNNGTEVLSADAKADFGSLGVKASGTFTGFVDTSTYRGAEGAAYFTDTLTFAGSGAVNVFFGWSIDGSASTSLIDSSQTLTYLNYQLNSGPIYSAFVAGTGGGGIDRAISPTAGTGTTVPGFAIAPGSVSGSGSVYSFLTPITLGTAFDFTVGLYAAAYPAGFTGSAFNDFFSTAKLSSIQAFDASGNRVAFSITSASGTLYDATGAHPRVVTGSAVPEPATWVTMLLGFGLTGGLMRRRGHNTKGSSAVRA